MTSKSFPSDLEIARAATAKPLPEIASQMGIGEHLLEPYGSSLAKIRLEAIEELRRSAEGEVRRRHRDHADAARRGQDHDDGRARAGHEAHRQACGHRLAAAVDGPDVRHQGRSGRRWLQPGHPDGPAQPAPHRRLPRRSRPPTTCCRRCSTTTSIRATNSVSTCTTSPGGGCSTSTTGRCATSSSGWAARRTASPARPGSTSRLPPR